MNQVRNARVPFAGPLALFLATAALGAYLAYDWGAGWRRFALILGGIALFYIVARIPEVVHLGAGRQVQPLRLLLILLPSAIAGYFLATHNWQTDPRGSAWIGPLRDWLIAAMLGTPAYQLEPNQAGGIVAGLLPLQVAALATIERRRLRVLVAAPTLALSVAVLFLSGAKGAILALLIVAAGWILWQRSERLQASPPSSRFVRRRRAIFTIVVVAGALLVFALLLTPRLGVWVQGSDSGRLDLWRNSLELIGDYPLTGLGLAGFEMAYSSYILLIHVPYLSHAHNIYLDVWLQQGVLGLLALIWLLAAAFGSRNQGSRWRAAAYASLGVILLHGLVDDSFYGYDGVGALLLFLPLGLIARTSEPASQASDQPRKRPVIRVAALAGIFVAIVMGATLPAGRATVDANLGALAQTRTELSVYRWPDYPIQDAVRRQEPATLAAAVARFQAALARNPADATANRRLGQIELSLGRYEEARRHLATAYAAAPEQRATRQLLGESYAVSGNVDEAAALWQTVDVTLGQLGLREGWYELIGDPTRAAWIAKAVRAMRAVQ